MKKTFEEMQQKGYEAQVVLEDVLSMMPTSTPKQYKLKKKMEEAWKQFGRAMERHEMMITDVVPPVQVDLEGKAKRFVDTWKLYCDYMIEQHGTRMGSRMQQKRLDLLLDYTDNDLDKAANWLNYYMASGSANIYKVKEQQENGKQQTTQETTGKASFSIGKR